MDLGLAGKRVAVTGASRGIGRATAEAFAAEGAHVIAIARSAADLDTLDAGPGRIEPWVMDVTDPALSGRIEAEGRLDVLVNNAGTNRPAPVTEVTDEDFEAILDVNVRALFRLSRAAARTMTRAGEGVIVMMSSQYGHVGAAGRSVYTMTKHAVEGLTKAMAVELGPKGVRVVAVAPTYIETPLTRPLLADPAFGAWVHGMLPVGRAGVPEDVARMVLFAASPAARMVTGTSLRVDGGWTAS